MSKEVKAIDPIVNLNRIISKLLIKGDNRIRNKKNREEFRNVLQEVASKGFIRTHAFITNSLLELFNQGEISTKTIHDIVKQLPWSWDKTKVYLDSLEQLGMIKYYRDSEGKKTCSLAIDKGNRTRQLTNLLESFKRNIDVEKVTREIQKVTFNYNLQLSKWYSKQKKKQQAENIKQVESSKIESLINDITSIICNTKKDARPARLLELVKKQPLLIRSLEWRK